MNGNYRVKYKLETGNGHLETLTEFECDLTGYMHEIEKAIRAGLSFTAYDNLFTNPDNRVYGLVVYIWRRC